MIYVDTRRPFWSRALTFRSSSAPPLCSAPAALAAALRPPDSPVLLAHGRAALACSRRLGELSGSEHARSDALASLGQHHRLLLRRMLTRATRSRRRCGCCALRCRLRAPVALPPCAAASPRRIHRALLLLHRRRTRPRMPGRHRSHEADHTISSAKPPLRQRDWPAHPGPRAAARRFGLGKVPARLQPDDTTTMVCGFCATGCGLNVHLKDGQAINLTRRHRATR